MLNGPTCQVDNLNMFDVGLSIAKCCLSVCLMTDVYIFLKDMRQFDKIVVSVIVS
jgi:hypothetical protein